MPGTATRSGWRCSRWPRTLACGSRRHTILCALCPLCVSFPLVKLRDKEPSIYRYPRPRVLISRCLGFADVRWDGARVEAPFVERLSQWTDVITVCPEVDLGLGVPRPPIRLVATDAGDCLIQPLGHRDLTKAMASFAQEHIDSLQGPEGQWRIDGAVLKARSPSCGVRDTKRYPAADADEPIGFGAGMYAREILSRFPDLPVADENDLCQPATRADWLTRLFTLADLRAARDAGTMHALMDFQARHKLLLMAHSVRGQKALGRIIANQSRLPVADLFASYAAHARQVLAQRETRGTEANALLHAFGYVSESLSPAARADYLAAWDAYRRGDQPRRAAVEPLVAWASAQQVDYLVGQSLWAPFPLALDDGEEVE